MQGKAADLASRDNHPLYPFAQKWATIDLTTFDNSEITTIEEHIKRKWADISAETAGEQYTPSDVIELATALIVELRREGKGAAGIAEVYDMACGGGNFLFAAEDSLREAFPALSVRTRGQELNDALYALASIEARFREDSSIEYGNTLTNDLFALDKFDVIVTNPPYGVDWKDFKTSLGLDASGRFDKSRMPPTSDGQLLFLQHAAFHLSDAGVAAIVHSGSTLFSGDAGGGESETRRWLIQQQDIVEAIIQLPKNEFFNTGIYTYLWILNRAKPAERKGYVLLINAETCFTKLKKNLNQKNCEIDEASRARIVEAFHDFADGPITRKLSIDELLYNKVELELHRHDEEGRAVADGWRIAEDELSLRIDDASYSIKQGMIDFSRYEKLLPNHAIGLFHTALEQAETLEINSQTGRVYHITPKNRNIRIENDEEWAGVYSGNLSIKAIPLEESKPGTARLEISLDSLWRKIQAQSISLQFDELTHTVKDGLLDLSLYEDKTVKEAIALFNETARYAETITVEANGKTYQQTSETGAIEVDGVAQGLGVLSVKAKLAKSKGKELAKVDIQLGPLWEKDTETVDYSSDAATNEQRINDFLTRWVHEPYRILGVKTGCEINFNRIFPKQTSIRSSQDILKDIAEIDRDLAELEAQMTADIYLEQ